MGHESRGSCVIMIALWNRADHNIFILSFVIVALCNRADHYIFALWFLSFFFFFSSRNLSGRRLDVYHTSTHGVALCKFRIHVWNVLQAARWKYRTQKNRHFGTIAQLCWAISSQLRHTSTIGKKLVKQQYVLHMSLQYGELTAH